MNKLLVALCIVLSGIAAYSNAKTRVIVNEDVFNRIIAKHIITDPYVAVIEAPQGGGVVYYITSQDGFDYVLSSKKREFANPKIWVVPAIGISHRS